MNKSCEICGMPCFIKPAGNNRTTGKPYSAFYACTSGDRKHYQQERPIVSSPEQPQRPTVNNNPKDPLIILSDEIVALRDSLAPIIKYFNEKIGK